MRYNAYIFDLNTSKIQISEGDLPSHIKDDLNVIETEITSEYIKKQDGKLGIKTLGNEIRYNDVLKSIFSTSKNDNVIIKLTENRRSFIKVFLDNWKKHINNNIYFLILDNEFGNLSNIVDKSFIRISEIEEELEGFFKFFSPKNQSPNIFFIEIKGFDKYNIISQKGYSQLFKKS